MFNIPPSANNRAQWNTNWKKYQEQDLIFWNKSSGKIRKLEGFILQMCQTATPFLKKIRLYCKETMINQRKLIPEKSGGKIKTLFLPG